MSEKPKRPLPLSVMAALKRVLPRRAYDRYVGRHEHGSLRLWRGIVQELPAEACVLDVGAYHGEYALLTYGLRPDLHVVAFEPNPTQLQTLRGVCADTPIVIEATALAETSGNVTFSLRGAESGIRPPTGRDETESLTVPATSLDDWAERNDRTPLLVKLDVEGGEAAILRGGAHVLAEARPTLLCEVLTDEAGSAVADALPSGYLCFEIDENKGPRLRDRPTRRVWRHYNWLLVPEERRAQAELW